MTKPGSNSTFGPSRATRVIIFVLAGIFFAVPLISMFEFTMRTATPGAYSLNRWVGLLTGPPGQYDRLFVGIGNSIILALVTVAIILVILFPTMVIVRLRFPTMKHLLEVVCLLPIMIPAIVLVVGLAPVYRMLSGVFGSGVWPLAFAYGITALPFAYRAIENNLVGLDVITLNEAGRSLGAGPISILTRILIPNLRQGLLSAVIISVALVFGEFTIASLLNRQNLQTSLLLYSQIDPFVAVIFAILALAFAFILLLVVSRIASASSRRLSERKSL